MSDTTTKPVSKAVAKREAWREENAVALADAGSLTREDLRRKVTLTELDDNVVEIRRAMYAADAVQDAVQWNAAILFGRAIDHSVLGEDAKQGDYAQRFGVSAGFGTKLRRLSLAIGRYAFLQPELPEWRTLCAVAQTGHGSTLVPTDKDKSMGSKEFREALREFAAIKAETGKFPPTAKRAAQIDDGSKAAKSTGSDEGSEESTPVTVVLPTAGDVKALLHSAFEMCNKLSDEAWADIESYVAEQVATQVDKRLVLAEQTRRVVTPADMPKAKTA
jgi:hypothetical protein